MNETHKIVAPERIAFVDVVRGMALVAMTVYHFTWDLEFFGWIEPGTTLQTQWTLFARGIASSFLYLVGVSLVLAHAQGIRWKEFWKRLAQVAAAAGLISATTYLAFPDGYIFFGILHAIALFSLVSLVFVKFHWAFAFIACLCVLVFSNYFVHDIFANPALWWVGLTPIPPRSNDYVPLFPWISAVLFGIAFAKIATRLGLWKPFASLQLPTLLQKPLSFIGRHSLIYYLVHQPALIAALWLFTAVVGEPDKTPYFQSQCVQECNHQNGKVFCTAYCSCMTDTMKSEKLFTPFLDRDMTNAQLERLYEVRDLCVRTQETQ